MRIQLLCALLALPVFMMSAVQAEDIQFVSTNMFIDMQNKMDQRLSDVEYRLSSFESMSPSEQPGCGNSGCDSCCAPCGTCTTPGFNLDAQMVFLRPYGGDSGQFDTNSKYKAGVRLIGGYTRDDGMGARIRWFSYGVETLDTDGNHHSYYVDLEMTDKFKLGCWDGVLAGGIRYSQIDQPDYEDGIRGWGPTVGLDVSRKLPCRNLYLIGNTHYSMIFGDEIYDDEDDFFSHLEVQLGVEYRSQLCGTADMFARAGFEGQAWMAAVNDDEEDLGLIGGVFAFGITR